MKGWVSWYSMVTIQILTWFNLSEFHSACKHCNSITKWFSHKSTNRSLLFSDGFLPLQSIDVPWNRQDWRINGLGLSANGIFLLTVLSPASYFCHLTLRKPSKVTSFMQISFQYVHKSNYINFQFNFMSFIESAVLNTLCIMITGL